MLKTIYFRLLSINKLPCMQISHFPQLTVDLFQSSSHLFDVLLKIFTHSCLEIDFYFILSPLLLCCTAIIIATSHSSRSHLWILLYLAAFNGFLWSFLCRHFGKNTHSHTLIHKHTYIDVWQHICVQFAPIFQLLTIFMLIASFLRFFGFVCAERGIAIFFSHKSVESMHIFCLLN